MERMSEQQSQVKKHCFFWRSGPFSQWFPSVYTFDGVEYTCAEQGMMHGKALLFKDESTAERILKAKSPHEIKSLGRRVRYFKEKVWKNNRWNIVYRDSMAKFTQNPMLQEALLTTSGMLVEASPRDRIWGIGLHEKDARKSWNQINGPATSWE